jgi:hypothetical protein
VVPSLVFLDVALRPSAITRRFDPLPCNPNCWIGRHPVFRYGPLEQRTQRVEKITLPKRRAVLRRIEGLSWPTIDLDAFEKQVKDRKKVLLKRMAKDVTTEVLRIAGCPQSWFCHVKSPFSILTVQYISVL